MGARASRHRLREDASFRAGVRTIAAGAVVVSTWLGVTLAWFVTLPPFGGPASIPRAFALAGGTTAGACALALVAGLLAATRWRRSALTAWATASVFTAVSAAAGAVDWRAGVSLLGVATVVVGAIWWALTAFDAPTGRAGGVEPDPIRWWPMPGWLRLGIACALAYFTLGQLRLALVYQRFAWLPLRGWNPREFEWGLLAILLVSLVPAFARHPHSARWAAYSAGVASGGGIALHLLGRWLLWPGLDGGCWVHTVEQGGLPDLVCADIVPAWWELDDFPRVVLGWTLGSMALAFLFGAAVVGVRYLAARRAGRLSGHAGFDN